MRKLSLGKITSCAAILLLWSCGVLRAGDAVAIGYNNEGVWTAVTYYSSSTGQGGADYKNEAEARAEAERHLKKRAPEGITRVEILSSSDRTGHFTYARGKTKEGKPDIHVVGFGATKEEAERKARAQLDRQGAKIEQAVIYQYFSQGASAVTPAPKK